MIIQDAGMFTQGTLHDKGRWQFFEYVDKEVLTDVYKRQALESRYQKDDR